MTHQPLYIADNIFLCLTEDYCVILDLRADNYLCMERKNMTALGPWLEGWPSSTQGSPPAFMPDELASFTAKLLEAGILTRDNRQSRSAAPTAVYPSTDVYKELGSGTARPSLLDWYRFALAAHSAHVALKRGRLEDTVRSVSNRRNLSDDNLTDPGSTDELSVLVAKFNTMRQAFPRRYLCLYDSLALVNFLSRFNFFPQWVFGVRSNPFMAHCWVQSGSVVLNDTLDQVCSYTPIMKV